MLMLLASAASAATKDPTLIARWVQMFTIVAGLLGAFLLAVIVMSTLRRKRAEPGRGAADVAPTLDAWSEAGRRAEPFGGGRAPESRRER